MKSEKYVSMSSAENFTQSAEREPSIVTSLSTRTDQPDTHAHKTHTRARPYCDVTRENGQAHSTETGQLLGRGRGGGGGGGQGNFLYVA